MQPPKFARDMPHQADVINSHGRLSAELVEAARLLSKHEVLSAHDLGRVKALASPPPSFTSERVAKIRIYKAKMSQSVKM